MEILGIQSCETPTGLRNLINVGLVSRRVKINDYIIHNNITIIHIIILQAMLLRISYDRHESFHFGRAVLSTYNFFSLVSVFSQKNKIYKIGLGVCVYVRVYVCKVLVPPNNFQTIYPIDTKFWLHTVSYRNSLTPLIQFLNFENCAREKYFNFISSPFN